MKRAFFTGVATAAAVSVLFVVAGSGVRSRDLSDLARQNCEAINTSAAANRSAWKVFENAVRASWEQNPPTAKERATTDKFFDDLYAKLQPIDCDVGGSIG